MSLTVEQVLGDAKRLVERLRDHDNAADSLIEQSTTLNKRIEAMKQYQEEVEEMNSIARHRPRSALILGIQQENRQIRELQRENRELRVALEEHQSALDLIMSSYREQVCRMVVANRFDKNCLNKHTDYHESTMASTAKIIEMAAVMKQAIELEEKASFDVEQQLTRLEVENRGLRELLEISRTVHSHHSLLHHHYGDENEKKDKEKDAGVILVKNEGAVVAYTKDSPSRAPPPRKDVEVQNADGGTDLTTSGATPGAANSEAISNADGSVALSAKVPPSASVPGSGNSPSTQAEPSAVDGEDESTTQSRLDGDGEGSTNQSPAEGEGQGKGHGEGVVVDLEVESVLNELADMTACLDMDMDMEDTDDTDSDA